LQSTKENEKKHNQSTASHTLEIPKELDESQMSQQTHDGEHEAIYLELGLDIFSGTWFGDNKDLISKWKVALMKDKIILLCLSKEDINTTLKKYSNNHPEPNGNILFH
jgi:hypothetical protein